MVDKNSTTHAMKSIQDNHSKILDGIKELLSKHGIVDFDVAQIKLFSKSGVALECPPGTTRTFECVTLPNGDVECRWICK